MDIMSVHKTLADSETSKGRSRHGGKESIVETGPQAKAGKGSIEVLFHTSLPLYARSELRIVFSLVKGTAFFHAKANTYEIIY